MESLSEQSDVSVGAKAVIADAALDRDATVRISALIAAVRVGEDNAVPMALQSLDDPDSQVRLQAVIALEQLRHSAGTARTAVQHRLKL